MRHSLLLLGLIAALPALGQNNSEAAGRLSPKELSIPPSPVFDLMGVTPSQINRTSDIKDFKVDWSFRSWKLNPNLALQSQPLWELLYNRKNLTRYQQASPLMRRLSSLDVSVGTVQNEDNDRRIGYALKMNLFKSHDPLMASGLYEDLNKQFAEEKVNLEKQLEALRVKLDTTANVLERPGIRGEIKSAEDGLLSWNTRRMQEINTRAKVYVEEHWNASALDVAFGRVYTYQTDSAGTLRKLRLNRNTGWGMWMNGGFGIGKKILVSGLLRTTWYEEELDFRLRDLGSGEETTARAVAENKLYSLGANLRYGSPYFNFFVEFLYERKALKTPVEALAEAFSAPGGKEIVGTSVKWTTVHPNSLSFGGDWRISRNVLLNYGMRCVFSKNWRFETFTPVASIACMMR